MKKLIFAVILIFVIVIDLMAIRPQTPYPPYPYDTLNVVISNTEARIKLAGTLSLPKSPKAAIVMATGSGQQDRDETIFGHRPFKVIADYLSRNGYAVLRMDDRGVGKSEGDPTFSTTTDFVSDIRASVDFLRRDSVLNKLKIGIIGHSEGGVIAYRAADNVDFIVTLAAPALRGDSIIVSQGRAIIDASGQSATWPQFYKTVRNRYNMVMSDIPSTILRFQLYSDVIKDIPQELLTTQLQERISKEITTMVSPWYREFLRYDPTEDIKAVKIPWLALNGTKDLQILCSQNLNTIKYLNPKVKIVSFDGLNHLFQQCQTGLPQEYQSIEQTIDPIVLETILQWLNETLM